MIDDVSMSEKDDDEEAAVDEDDDVGGAASASVGRSALVSGGGGRRSSSLTGVGGLAAAAELLLLRLLLVLLLRPLLAMELSPPPTARGTRNVLPVRPVSEGPDMHKLGSFLTDLNIDRNSLSLSSVSFSVAATAAELPLWRAPPAAAAVAVPITGWKRMLDREVEMLSVAAGVVLLLLSGESSSYNRELFSSMTMASSASATLCALRRWSSTHVLNIKRRLHEAVPHSYGCGLFSWRRRWSLRAKPRLQFEHLYGSSPVCVRM